MSKDKARQNGDQHAEPAPAMGLLPRGSPAHSQSPPSPQHLLGHSPAVAVHNIDIYIYNLYIYKTQTKGQGLLLPFASWVGAAGPSTEPSLTPWINTMLLLAFKNHNLVWTHTGTGTGGRERRGMGECQGLLLGLGFIFF